MEPASPNLEGRQQTGTIDTMCQVLGTNRRAQPAGTSCGATTDGATCFHVAASGRDRALCAFSAAVSGNANLFSKPG
ncbi:hypothetical protein V5799_025071 [Amblyomma americanum]|uniref:Uncharacterized protein n=1 Tax=Amblyomma americanum TaxID=6943 RepID=A0AAQ4EAB1_AMBAM